MPPPPLEPPDLSIAATSYGYLKKSRGMHGGFSDDWFPFFFSALRSCSCAYLVFVKMLEKIIILRSIGLILFAGALSLCERIKATPDTATQDIGHYCNQLQSLNLG